MFTCKFKFSDLEVLRNFIVNNNLDFKKVVILSATELDMPVMIQDVAAPAENPVPVVATIKAPRVPSVVKVEHVIVPKEEPHEEPPLKEEEVAHKPKRKKPVVAQVEPAVTIEVEDNDPEPLEAIPEEQEVIPDEPSHEEVPTPSYGLAEDFLEDDDDESTSEDEDTDEEEEEEDEPQEPIVHSAQPPSSAEFRNTNLEDSLKNVTIDTHEDEDEPEDDEQPSKKLYNKMCHKCGNAFTSEVSSAKFCPACMPPRTAKPKPKPEKPPKKPKQPSSSQPVVVKPTGPRRCIRCGSMLPEDSQSKICYKCAKTLADSGRELSDVMRTEIELALACKPSKISRVCLKCREPFFTEEGSPASYCPSCMKKLAAQESEIPKKTGFF